MATPTASMRPLVERARRLSFPAELPAALLGLVLVTPIASADGGYDATSWGWITLGLSWVVIVALLLRSGLELSRLELLAVGAISLLAVWTLLSAAWSHDAGGSVLSFERLLVYVTALAAVLVLVGRAGLSRLLASVWGGGALVCGYALLTRLYPDHFPTPLELAGNRLAEPIGYWNGLGLLAAVTLLAAVGVVVTFRSRILVALAGLSTVPTALALYFTFSRGALLALGVGIVVALAFDSFRLRTASAIVVLAPWAALAVRDASRTVLVRTDTPPAAASSAGGHLVHTVVPWMILGGVCAFFLGEAARRLAVPRRAERWLTIALAVLAAVLVAGALAVASHRYGSPVGFVKHAYKAFTTENGSASSPDLNKRLFTFNGTHRGSLDRIALDEWKAHPLTGSGAGTYVEYWLRDRPAASQAVNAHNLYFETLAELGPVGLVLLLVALLAPLAAAWRIRGAAAVGITAAAYSAFLVHVFFDWDWQLPGVALAPFLLGAGLLVASRREQERPLRGVLVYGASTLLALVAVVSLVTLVANRAATAAAHQTAAGNYDAAIASAKRAHRFEPWSADPWRLLGEAQLAQGNPTAAQASFQTALAKDRSNWRLWLDLALASNGPQGRRTNGEQALRLNPLSPELGQVAKQLGLHIP